MKNVLLISTVLFLCVCVFTGCQQEESNNDVPDKSSFLYINSEINLSDMSGKDLRTLSEAFQRLDIQLKDGLYVITQTSAGQINISDKLFSYFKNIENEMNKKIEESSLYISIPRVKTARETEDTGGGISTDCVARTITAMVRDLGASISYSEINTWVTNKYGKNGVPGSAFSEALNHFLRAESVPLPPAYISGGSAYPTVIAINTPGGGHAATLIGINGTTVLYRDDQNGGAPGQCNTWDIVYIYRITGVR